MRETCAMNIVAVKTVATVMRIKRKDCSRWQAFSSETPTLLRKRIALSKGEGRRSQVRMQ
jgi:hypothetical protein